MVRDKTLMELQLVPSSVLLLRFLSNELNGERYDPYAYCVEVLNTYRS